MHVNAWFKPLRRSSGVLTAQSLRRCLALKNKGISIYLIVLHRGNEFALQFTVKPLEGRC